jgi:hypothetical protein
LVPPTGAATIHPIQREGAPVHRTFKGLVVLVLAVSATSGMAGAPPATEPEHAKPLAGLAACHAIADVGQRAACYDREYAALQAAVDKGDVMMVDREGVRQTRQSLFGFSLPGLAIFGGGNADKDKGKGKSRPDSDELEQLNATVRSARTDQDGRWLIVLDNGATWRQMDDSPLGRSPRAGDPVLIRRAALGSFIMRIGSMPGFKAHREG